MTEQMLSDIQALLLSEPEGPVKDEIWARYGDAIKARVAAEAEANGWRQRGGWWEKAG